MREYPIIFSAPMVRAILDGRKTQTRLLPTSRWANAAMHVEADEPVRLWVKEEHAILPPFDPGHDPTVIPREGWPNRSPATVINKWRAARFMPRWASRITLDVVSMRTERLQEISASDCAAEGLEMRQHLWRCEGPNGGEWRCYTASECYRWLWDSIHRKPGTRWANNPEVYVIEFRP